MQTANTFLSVQPLVFNSSEAFLALVVQNSVSQSFFRWTFYQNPPMRLASILLFSNMLLVHTR